VGPVVLRATASLRAVWPVVGVHAADINTARTS